MSDGDRAWIVLAAYVLVYDTIALHRGRETMSASYTRALGSPSRRWPTIAAWALLTGHLFDALGRSDPFRYARKIIE